MYEASLTLAQPDWSLQPLWRYLPAQRLLDLLRTGELFFSHLPKLEDALEGGLTNRTRERLATWFQHHEHISRVQAYAAVNRYQEHQHQFYVNCWHMNRHESYLMWKAYSGRGYAIQTTFERLRAAFGEQSPVVTGGIVKYVDFERDLTPTGNVFHHVATKDMPFFDEREFRLVYWAVEPRNQGHPVADRGVRVPVDVQMLVGAIVVSPLSDPIDGELEELIETMGLPLRRSGLVLRRES